MSKTNSSGRNHKRSNSRVVGGHVLTKCGDHSAVREGEAHMYRNEKETERVLAALSPLFQLGFVTSLT